MADSDDLVLAALERRVSEAEGAYDRGEYTGALDAYRRILKDRLAAHRGTVDQLLAADLVVVDRLADLSVLFGLFDAADDLLHAMVSLTRSKGNDLAADYAQLKRAELSLSRGAVREAFDRLRELEGRIGDITAFDMSPAGFALWEQKTAWRCLPAVDREVLFSRTYYLFVRLLAAIGQYLHAITAAERSEVHTGPNVTNLAQQARLPTALARASSLFEGGDLDDADGTLRSLEGAAKAARQPAWHIEWLQLRGRLDLARGEFAGAAARFEYVLMLCLGGGFRQATVAANLNLAHLLILLNRIRDALGHIAEAEQDARVLDDRQALARAGFLRSIADARRRSISEGVSLELSVTEMLRRGRSTAAPQADAGGELIDVPQSSNFLSLFEDRALQVQWLIAQGHLAEARSLLSDLGSAQLFGSTQSRLIRTRLDVLRGLLAYYRQEPRIAMGLFASAARQLQAMGLRPELWQVLRLQGWCAAQLEQRAEEQAFVDRAERLLEEIASSLDGAERAIFLLNKWTAEEEYLASEIARLVREKAAFLRSHFLARPLAWLKMARRLNRLMARIDRHKALVAENAVGVVAPTGREPSLLRRLLTGTRQRIVISFLVLPDRTLVVHAGRGYLDFHVSVSSRIELREQVRRWHERMHASSTVRDLTAPAPVPLNAQPGEASKLARPLAEALQLPQLLASLPARISELTIVPDDALHGFPFAALELGDKQLTDRFAVSTRFETGDLPKSNRTGPATALLVAVSRGSGRIPPLPQTIKEIERVRHWLAERRVITDILVDDSATKAGVMNAMHNATMFHIACHGLFVPDQPDASGMLLIPDLERTEILSLRDLSQLRLTRCEHVTLSSCWSADNFILPGRRIVSLPETLYRAGARSILACTWPVDDQVAEQFLARFYAHAGTCSRAEALRRTQIECRSGALPGCEGIDTSDPFYWAGFNLFGESSRLDL
jgi:CHAT domain-containing protein